MEGVRQAILTVAASPNITSDVLGSVDSASRIQRERYRGMRR